MGAKSPEEKRRAKYAAIMRERGTPLHITDEEHAQLVAHIMRLYRRGMSCQAIIDSIPGCTLHDSAVSKITGGRVGKCHRDTYNVLMRAVWVQPTATKTGRRLDGTGHRRRLRGLVANGFPLSVLAELVGVSTQALFQQAVRESDVHASTIAALVPWYEKLCDADPADWGASKLGISRARNNAKRRGWEPTTCWDSDTIDDPDVIPEWTGACGTVTGYNLHRKHRINIRTTIDRHGNERVNVLCDACCVARTRQKSEIEEQRKANRDTVLQMIAEGQDQRRVALELGMSVRTVQRIVSAEK